MTGRAAQLSLGLALAAGWAATAAAQEAPRPRTGPDAAPPVQPGYAPPLALTQPAFAMAAPVPRAPLAALTVSDVRVLGERAADSTPPSGWRPPAEALSGLTLEHTPGERLDAEWVHRQFQLNGLVGVSGTVDRALALVQLINASFVNAGFINSGLLVPRQNALADEVLTLELVYGRLSAPATGTLPLSVEFADGSRQGLTAAYLAHRMPSAFARPLSGLDIERDFRLLADDPAIRTINADLRPGSRPGEASLRLLVDPQDRFDAYITAGTSRSPSVGGERIAGGGALRNLVSGGDLLSLETGRTKGLDDYTGSYVTPLFTPRLSLSLRGSINNAAVVDSQLVPLDIRSRDRAGEIGVTYGAVRNPLTPLGEGGWKPASSLSFGVAVAQRRSRSFLLGQPFSFAPGSVDGRSKYTAARLLGDLLLRSVNQVFAASVTATMGLEGTRTPLAVALNPDKNFKALLVQLNYARRLSGNGLELRARATGQVSDSILYAGERLSSGGANTVRGYRENLLLTDQGVIGSVELSQPFSLSGRERSGFDWGGFSIAGFVDGARLHNFGSAATPTRSLYSVGASLSWIPSDAIVARATYGHALTDVGNLGKRDLQDRGFHFSLTLYPLRLLR